MRRPPSAMRAWLRKATAEEKRELAKSAKTSVVHLHHIASGRRGVSAELAQRLAHASKGELNQQELCLACSKCPLI